MTSPPIPTSQGTSFEVEEQLGTAAPALPEAMATNGRRPNAAMLHYLPRQGASDG